MSSLIGCYSSIPLIKKKKSKKIIKYVYFANQSCYQNGMFSMKSLFMLMTKVCDEHVTCFESKNVQEGNVESIVWRSIILRLTQRDSECRERSDWEKRDTIWYEI